MTKQIIYDKDIIDIVEAEPGIDAIRMAAFFGVDHKTVSERARRLYREGKVDRRDIQLKGVRGVLYGYFPGTGTPPIPDERKRKVPTPAGIDATIKDLREQLAHLEEWKAEALRRHPDLAVSELTLKARRIVQQTNPGHAPFRDDSPIMLAVMAALEENQ